MVASRRTLASGLLVLALAACGGPNDEQELSATPATSMEGANDVPTPPSGKVVLARAARSIWGVVPDPPRRKKDLQPELIRGTAVAVATDTLLASCQAVGERQQVGVVRHNKYRVAEVLPPSQPDQDVCALHVVDAPLNVIGGFRSYPDLRVGEPLYAVISRTSAEYALAEGQLVAKGAGSSQLLETTLALPPGTLSAVLFDARGNLIGLGSGGPTEDSVAVGAPVAPALASGLAQRDLGPAIVRVASVPVEEPPVQRGCGCGVTRSATMVSTRPSSCSSARRGPQQRYPTSPVRPQLAAEPPLRVNLATTRLPTVQVLPLEQ